MVTTIRTPFRVAVMLVVAIVLPPALALILATPTAHAWSHATMLAVERWHDGVWRLLRGGVKWVAPPVVSLVVAWALLHLVRHGRRRTAWVAFVVGAGAFLTTEAIKFGWIPFPSYAGDGRPELSGHVAMTASAFVVVVLGMAGRHRSIGVAIAQVLLIGMGVAIVVSRWHDTADVVIALGVTTSWALVARAWFVAAGRETPPAARRGVDAWMAAVAVSSGIAALLLVLVGDATSGAAPGQTLAAGVLATIAAVFALTIATTGLAADVTA